MSVSILKLKQNKLRKTYKIGDETVEVYNITNENRELFEKVFEQNTDFETGEINLTNEAVLLSVYVALTNIEFANSQEVMEVLENPSVELEQINNEIRIIITEYANVKIQEQLAKVQELEMLFNQSQLTALTEDIAQRAGFDKDKEVKKAEEKLKGMRSSKKEVK